MDVFNGRPGDRRNFVHKRIIGAIKGFATGGPLGAIAGAVSGGGGGGGRSLVPSCGEGFYRDTNGNCQPLLGTPREGFIAEVQRFLPSGFTGRQEVGAAVMGQYGAALEPGIRPTNTRVCPPKTVLGSDGLCYNRRDIRNKERMWPKGRAPLLTGGEMRCISIASRAANKLQRKQKQLIELGMLKGPPVRRQKKLAAGHHAHVAHD